MELGESEYTAPPPRYRSCPLTTRNLFPLVSGFSYFRLKPRDPALRDLHRGLPLTLSLCAREATLNLSTPHYNESANDCSPHSRFNPSIIGALDCRRSRALSPYRSRKCDRDSAACPVSRQQIRRDLRWFVGRSRRSVDGQHPRTHSRRSRRCAAHERCRAALCEPRPSRIARSVSLIVLAIVYKLNIISVPRFPAAETANGKNSLLPGGPCP